MAGFSAGRRPPNSIRGLQIRIEISGSSDTTSLDRHGSPIENCREPVKIQYVQRRLFATTTEPKLEIFWVCPRQSTVGRLTFFNLPDKTRRKYAIIYQYESSINAREDLFKTAR